MELLKLRCLVVFLSVSLTGCVHVQEKFSGDIVRIIQYNAELTEESVAYTSHVASATARSLFTKVGSHTRVPC